jgi:hypothetical protein
MADQLSAAVERLEQDIARLEGCSGYASHFGTPRNRDDTRWNHAFAVDLRLVLAALRAQEAVPAGMRELLTDAADYLRARSCEITNEGGSSDTANDGYRIALGLEAMLAAAPASPALEQFAENAKCSDQAVWKPIETAPKDGTWVLAIVGGASDRWKHLNGRAFVIRHEGKTPSGFDLGWSVYPGFGGTGDQWFTHWMPLPAPPLTEGE